MLRFKLKELIAEKEFQEGRVVTLVGIAESTGIHYMMLSKRTTALDDKMPLV